MATRLIHSPNRLTHGAPQLTWPLDWYTVPADWHMATRLIHSPSRLTHGAPQLTWPLDWYTVPADWHMRHPRGGYSVRKLLGVCRGPLKIGPKKIEGKMVFWGQKDRILRGFVPKRSFLCWWMRKNTPKRSCSILPKWKKGVKTAAHMYHPSHREYPPPGRHPS